MKKTAFVHTGSFYHLATLKDPAVVARDLTEVYWPDYTGNFSEFDSIYLAARSHPRVLEQKHDQLVNFLQQPGKKLYIDGCNQVSKWLPGTTEIPRGTNFWSWRTGEDLGRRSVNQTHPIWEYLSEEAVHWHYHGALTPPQGAVPLVRLEKVEPTGPGVDPWGGEYLAAPDSENVLLYFDEVTFPAQIIVSTMDASYHHGSGFMPGATQLLYRMLIWLAETSI